MKNVSTRNYNSDFLNFSVIDREISHSFIPVHNCAAIIVLKSRIFICRSVTPTCYSQEPNMWGSLRKTDSGSRKFVLRWHVEHRGKELVRGKDCRA